MKITISKLGTLRRRRQGDSSRCAEPHRKIGERSLEILESAIDREDLLVDCAPLRDGGGIEGAKVVLADDELRRRRNGGRVVALSVGAEDAVEISDRPGSPWTGVGGRCKRRKLRHTSRAYL